MTNAEGLLGLAIGLALKRAKENDTYVTDEFCDVLGVDNPLVRVVVSVLVDHYCEASGEEYIPGLEGVETKGGEGEASRT